MFQRVLSQRQFTTWEATSLPSVGPHRSRVLTQSLLNVAVGRIDWLLTASSNANQHWLQPADPKFRGELPN